MKYTLHGEPVRQRQTRPSNYAPAAAWNPLSKTQRQGLAMLAKRAWRIHGRGENEHTWRRAQCIRVCGRRITEAVQRDFLPLRAHFLDLIGESGAAMNVHLAHDSEPQRIALFKLNQECRKRGLPIAYPEAICRKQYRCSLAEASAPQIWRLVFTVRNRRAEQTRPIRSA